MLVDSITNLLDLDVNDLTNYCSKFKEKNFKVVQLQRWIHKHGVDDFDKMTNLSYTLRQNLKKNSKISAPLLISEHISNDGTKKWIFDVGNNNAIETVFIPELTRGTLCISSQVGCAISCCFCSSGKQGFIRNLTISEIIGQVWKIKFFFLNTNNNQKYKITNIVFMGMGEPLLNLNNIIPTISLLLNDNAYSFSRRKITLSTSGIIPMMDKLSRTIPVAIAVSLHAPNDKIRDLLVPINRKYPLRELMAACLRYIKYSPQHFITFEYCMLNNINDNIVHAKELIKLVNNIPCKLNLIQWNAFPQSKLQASENRNIQIFADILIDAGLVTTIRKIRGRDINAACGQLSGIVNNSNK